MKTLNLLIKRELLQIFKFNRILHGEKKEKRVYISISCTILVGMSIFAVYWFCKFQSIGAFIPELAVHLF